MQKTINDLIQKIKSYSPKADVSLVERAFKYASSAHEGQKRRSGEPFVSHPLAVALILAELEQDEITISAALLHDVIEDGGVTKEVLSKDFSAEVASLVEGVTKLGQLTYESKETRQAENFRKMFLAMGEDIRIIIIKLADRLHNMQTLEFLQPAKQKENAVETRDIFAPLAHRLGMWMLKWELEDLSFRFLDPDKFGEIKDSVEAHHKERDKFISGFINELKKTIDELGISSQISGRAKHLYSIYNKMVAQNLKFEEVYDIVAVRVIVDTVRECYAALGVIHARWKPIPGRFRDYVAMPKPNGYQSLHTTVIGPSGRPVEIQIRTEEMHRISEYGIAAHWRYKEGETDKKLDLKMSWLRHMLDWQTDLKDAKDFMESLKLDLFTAEVFVFTPKGSVFELPVGATPVDFAYRVHTEVGHRCMGAKVNGRIVPLSHKLINGDIVEIITSKSDSPKLDWLNFVKTTAARTKIKSWFKRLRKEDNINHGRAVFEGEIRKLQLNLSEILIEDRLSQLVREYGFASSEDFYSAMGYGEVSAYLAAKKIRSLWQKEHGALPIEEEEVGEKLSPRKRHRGAKYGVRVAGQEGVLVRFSRCCRPLPGDDIVGFVTKGRGVSIHRRDCSSAAGAHMPKNRMVVVEWIPGADVLYSVDIEVEAFDRVGVLKDILEKVVETKTNVAAANVRTKRGSSAIIKLVVDIKDVEHLSLVTKAIREVSDVYDVNRADTNKKIADRDQWQ
jgi:GTP pyrophosphokinase